MASSVTIDSHEAIVLTLSNLYHAVKVASLEKRVENQLLLRVPVLPAEGSVRELDIVGSFDVAVGKSKRTVIPSIVSILEPRAQVYDFCFGFWGSEAPANEHIVALGLEDYGDRLRKVQFGVPAACIFEYPVSMSG